ncbi:MAG: hypothetical protein ACHQIM_12915 [Sphingobacteriales bacterium]
MFNKAFLTLLFAAILFSSCAPVYSPAIYHQDIVYQPKPTSHDTVKTANYVSAGFNAFSNSNDLQLAGEFDLSRAYTTKHFNFALGGFGVFGDYGNSNIPKNDPNYFSDKFFGAFGGRASADYFIRMGGIDFRIIGIEAAYSHEFGSYAGLRQYLNTQPGYYVDQRINLFTVGLTTEIIFNSRRDNNIQQGFQGFLGTTLGHNELDNPNSYYSTILSTDPKAPDFHNIFGKFSYFIKLKNYFGTVEVGQGVFLRLGLKF